MGYQLRSRSIGTDTIHLDGIPEGQTGGPLPGGSGGKKGGTARAPPKHAKRRSDGILKSVDANIRSKPHITKTTSKTGSKARSKTTTSLPNLERWHEGHLGRSHDKPGRVEQENARREDTGDDAVRVQEKPTTKSGTASFQWLPAPRTVTVVWDGPPIYRRIGNPFSKQAIKIAEKDRFYATYVTAGPSWTICGALPQPWMSMQSIEDFSSNCIYRLPILAQRESCSFKALEEFRDDQEARDRVGLCWCQQPPNYTLPVTAVITKAGFHLIKHWR